jgi:hypothetical protein
LTNAKLDLEAKAKLALEAIDNEAAPLPAAKKQKKAPPTKKQKKAEEEAAESEIEPVSPLLV